MKFPSFAWLAVLICALIGTLLWWANRPQSIATPTAIPTAATNSTQPPLVATVTNISPGASANVSSAEVKLRPLAVAKQTSLHEWTAGDGKSPELIQQIAHNELERQRMLDENARIQRRQLVYRKDTVAAVLQRARLSGDPVEQLTLPGFDGQELQFVIQRADLESSKQVGTFAGHLAGQPNSIVTLAFHFGREAFTVLSPEEGIYFQGQPREPGEIILTSFDPETYSALPGGEPIVTTNTFKIAQ